MGFRYVNGTPTHTCSKRDTKNVTNWPPYLWNHPDANPDPISTLEIEQPQKSVNQEAYPVVSHPVATPGCSKGTAPLDKIKIILNLFSKTHHLLIALKITVIGSKVIITSGCGVDSGSGFFFCCCPNKIKR